MPYQNSLRTVLAACSVLSLAPQVLAHMEMSWPYPLHSKYNPANSYTIIDYSMTAPLVADGSNFPCKGYQNDRPTVNVATYEAGSTYNMTIAGSAVHGGGSCQLSLSYDNGATFRVIKSMIGGCPLTATYDFTIPSYAPDGNALFAWSWQNLQGNREFYMNCAEIEVTGSSVSKRSAETFEALPFMWKANLAGINTCATTEMVNVVYPEPGPDVIYGSGVSSSDPATSGTCNAATPFGQTYKDLGDTDEPQTATVGGSASTAAASSKSSTSTKSSIVASSATTLVTSTKPASSSSKSSSAVSSSVVSSSSSKSTAASTGTSVVPSSSSKSSSTTSSVQTSLSVQSPRPVATKSGSTSIAIMSSTTLLTSTSNGGSESTCAPDVTITIYADSTGTSTGKGSVSASASASLTGSTVSTLLGFSTTGSSTVVVVSAASSGPASSKAASGTSSASGAQVTEESYATGDLATYLPCVPGTYICTSNTTWVTCDRTMYSDGSTAWVYEESRTVAPGMACVPNLSPYSSATIQYAQQADAPSGYYRDDRYAAAQTYGACSPDGSIECTDGGSQFFMCDHGGYKMMGSVAAGTTCQNGAIVASN